MSNWKVLIKRYADGRDICNCGDAYYTRCGIGAVWDKEKGDYVRKTDMLACEYGCSSNQITAKEFIAECVLKEMV